MNLAAVHRTPGHVDAEYYETNVEGATNVVDWCHRVGASTLTFTSSISVYGPAEDPKDESSPLSAVSAYGKSKAMAEEIHRLWRASAGPQSKLVIVRPAVVFGPGENGNFTRLASALAARRFAYPGRTDAVKACGYVGDLVEALDFVLGIAENEIVFNYCYPTPYTIADVCAAFHEVAGYPLPRRIPKALVGAVMAVGAAGSKLGIESQSIERMRKLLQSTNVHPAELVDRGFVWRSDLADGLRRWRSESPTGSFE